MKKHLANIVTASRIMVSIVLLFFDATSLPFYITYLLCGFSDMIDGTIARKTNSVSDFGSKHACMHYSNYFGASRELFYSVKKPKKGII